MNRTKHISKKKVKASAKKLKPESGIMKYYFKDDGQFPNSRFPAILYKGALDLPALFPAAYVRKAFEDNDWGNTWKSGVFTYHHYHSTAHEVMGVIRGKTMLLLGGENGMELLIRAGDVLILPAGVAHKNLGKKNDVVCIGAYPHGDDYDINIGIPGERLWTIENIKRARFPAKDPVLGSKGGLTVHWTKPRKMSGSGKKKNKMQR